MKKLNFNKIVLSLVLLLFFSASAFAMFYKKTEIHTNIELLNFNINENQLSSSSTFSHAFSAPGDIKEIELNVNNNVNTDLGNSGVPLSYYFGLEIEEASTGLENSILVYYNDEFIGTLASLCTTGDIKIEYLIKPEALILPGEQNLKNKIKFELHNGANNSIFSAKTASIKISLYTKTVDVQKYTFVKSEYEFTQAVKQINSGDFADSRTIVLANDITFTQNFTITKPSTIDLLGKTINFSGNTLTLSSNGLTTITSTRAQTDTSSNTVKSIILDNIDGVLDITTQAKKYSPNVLVTNCDKTKAMYYINERVKQQTSKGIISGGSIGILSGLDFYISNNQFTVTTSGEYIYDSGIATAYSTPITIPTYFMVDSENYEFKVIGTEDYVLSEILNTDLKHISLINNQEISYNLFLPTKLKYRNATIEWWSSDKSLMSNSGRCPETADGEVSLIATIKINNKIYTQEFKFTVVKMNNDMRFQYLLDKIGDIVLNTVGIDGLKSLPTLDNYMNDYLITEDLGIASIQCDVNPKYYYISRTSSNEIFLNQATFDRLASVDIKVKFLNENIDDPIHEGIIPVQIIPGNSAELIDKVYEYVQGQIDNVNVWSNILTTRQQNGPNSESGDFSLPSEYMGFNITYTFPAGTEIATNTVNMYQINIHPDKLLTAQSLVTIEVTVEGGEGYRSMVLNVPGALHNDIYGFEDSTLFYSTRGQVYASLGYSSVQNKNYIFINDIPSCTTLTYAQTNGNFSKSIKGFEKFTALTSLTVNNTTAGNTLLKYAAYLKSLTTIVVKNTLISDITPICSLPLLTSLDVSQNANIININQITSLDLTKLSFFDASSTGINFTYFSPLYNYAYYTYSSANSNVPPSYYYTNSGTRTLYTPTNTSANYIKAMRYCYLLKEFNSITAAYVQLPNRVLPNTTETFAVTWAVAPSQTIVSIENTSITGVRRLKLGTGKGTTYVTASITVSGVTFTRYFVITV